MTDEVNVPTVDEFKQYFTDKLDRTGSLDQAFTKAVWSAFRVGYNMGIDDGLMGKNVKFKFDRRPSQGTDKAP